MSESGEEIEVVPTLEVDIPVLPSVGAQLLSAREQAGLTVADVAQALKLGARQVEALESGNWQALPGNTFIRGFVRNYARMVHIDAAPLMRQLDGMLVEKKEALELHEGTHVEMPGQGGRPQRRDVLVVLSAMGLAALAALIYFLLPDDLSQLKSSVESRLAAFSHSEPEAPKSVLVAPGEPVLPPGANMNQVMNPQSVQAGGEPAAATGDVKPAQPVAPSATPSAPASESATPVAASAPLKMSFVRESWVEVRDRRGNVILSQRGQSGMSKEVEGTPPFSLVIGYAPGVSLTYRGQVVDLAPHSKGDVARLTLE